MQENSGKGFTLHEPEEKPLMPRLESTALLLPAMQEHWPWGGLQAEPHRCAWALQGTGLLGCPCSACITAQVMDVPIKAQPEHLSVAGREDPHLRATLHFSGFVLNAPHARFRVFTLQGRCTGLISNTALIITYTLEWSLCKHRAQICCVTP